MCGRCERQGYKHTFSEARACFGELRGSGSMAVVVRACVAMCGGVWSVECGGSCGVGVWNVALFGGGYGFGVWWSVDLWWCVTCGVW